MQYITIWKYTTHFNTLGFFTGWRGDFSRVKGRNDFSDLDVKNISFGVSVDEHVAPVGYGERVEDVLECVEGDAATVVATLSLLDPRVEREISLPDWRRAGKLARLESDVKVGFQKSHLLKRRKRLLNIKPTLRVNLLSSVTFYP
jgi:hypothetical protein